MHLKAGFGVSSKNFKKATDRNKIKRLMREAYRLQKGQLFTGSYFKNAGVNLFFIYTGREIPAYEVVFEKLGGCITRLLKYCDD